MNDELRDDTSAVDDATPQRPSDTPARSLRSRAESRLVATAADANESVADGSRPATSAELQRLVHELRVHQIELEIQNEELHVSRQVVERERQRYVALYDFAPAGYISLSANGTIRELNLTAVTMLAHPRTSLVGRQLQAIVHESSVATLLECVARVFSEGTPQECDVSLPLDGAPTHTLRLRGTFDADQELCRLSLLDVTTQRVLERALRQSQRMEAVGRLAGGIAHDFNNLLTVINGGSALLLEELQDHESLRAVARDIGVAGDRAAMLTRQLLTFSRCLAHDAHALDVNVLLRELVSLLRRLLGDHVTLRMDLCTERVYVMLALGQFEQAVINLVVNARDAMPLGGTVRIRTSLVSDSAPDPSSMTGSHVSSYAPLGDAPGGDYVRRSVEDSGEGMNAETVHAVFEPFFTTKDQGKGTGLGLAVLFGIVQQAGGFITVSSQVGRGSRFNVFFRRTLAPETPVPALPTEVLVGPETVLIVEDEQSIRTVTRRMLETRGYRVLEAADRHSAMTLVREFPGVIDVLIVDVMMPEISGWDVASDLWDARPGMGLLFTSGAGVTSGDVRHHTPAAAVSAFLPKPYSWQELLIAVRSLLDARVVAECDAS